jgi:hypothetical protein
MLRTNRLRRKLGSCHGVHSAAAEASLDSVLMMAGHGSGSTQTGRDAMIGQSVEFDNAPLVAGLAWPVRNTSPN